MADIKQSSPTVFGMMMENLKVLQRLIFSRPDPDPNRNQEALDLQKSLEEIAKQYKVAGKLDEAALIETGRGMAERLVKDGSWMKALESAQTLSEQRGTAGPIERGELIDFQLQVISRKISENPQMKTILETLPEDERSKIMASILTQVECLPAQSEDIQHLPSNNTRSR